MQAKKHLGQNFLISPYAISDIIKTADIKPKDTTLEIGPGKGVLTEALLKSGANVISIEKDIDLIPLLEEKFKKEIKNKKLTLINDDILGFDLEKIKSSYKLVANIPYYITGQIIRKFLESEKQPKEMTLLVQKEVAERATAKDKKESLLSISIKAYGEPLYIRSVSKGSFVPKPKVDSAILAIKNISNKNFKKQGDKDNFFKIIHAGFAHKRKQLLPNLARAFPKNNLHSAFDKLNIDSKTRAEDISLNDWLSLSKEIN